MNKKAWFEAQRTIKNKRPLPLISFPCVQCLEITVEQLVTDSAIQAEGISKMAELYPSAAAVSMMDLSVEAEAFGAPIRFSNGEVPAVKEAIVTDEEEAKSLEIPSLDKGRCKVYAEAIRTVKKKVTDRPVFAGMIGPFSLSGRLLDMTEIMVDCYVEPEKVECVLKKAEAFILSYGKLLKEAGADGVVIAEPAAGLLSPEFNRTFSVPYVKRIVDAIKNDDFAVIYHNCGNVVPLLDDILSIGADAYHFGNMIDLPALAERIPDDVFFMGNIDPVGVFCNATPEETEAKVTDLLKKIGHKENFILSSGCDVPAKASLANIEAFYRAAEKYYRK